MLKKILIVAGILLVIGAILIGVAGYQVVKVADDFYQAREPELRQYVTMSVEEQNAYVEKNLTEFLTAAINNSDVEEDKKIWNQIKDNPETKAIGIEFGRSLVANVIIASDSIIADVKDDVKEKLQKEAEQFEARSNKLSQALEKIKAQ